MIDLFSNKYSRQTLKDNIYAIKLLDILKTQCIDSSFAAKYILNKKYQLHKEDENITLETVLKYQPHINKMELSNKILNYDSDDDSVLDFETYSNLH
jgi:hypothetical protein